jgi:hypothetical protein
VAFVGANRINNNFIEGPNYRLGLIACVKA